MNRLIIASVTLVVFESFGGAARADGYRDLAAAASEGRGVDLFTIDSDDSVVHRYQRGAGDFASFEGLGGTAADIAALELGDGRVEVFIVDHNQTLWHNRQAPDTKQWTGWEQLDNATKQVSVARSANGRVELFEIGGDDRFWHMGRDNDDASFGDWQQLDLEGTQLSAAAADGEGFEVVVIGKDQSLWRLSFGGSGELLSDPSSLGGASLDVALARLPQGGHALMTIGTNNELWERRREAGQDYGDWGGLGRFAQHIASTSTSAGVQLFTLTDAGELAQSQLTAAGSDWTEPEVITEASPLTSHLQGRARLIIPSLNVDKDVAVDIGLRFSIDRTHVDISSFPSVVTDPFDTPFGNTTSTVSLAHSSTGSLQRDDGSLSLPVTLHFDQSLDLPIVGEDADLSIDLSSAASGGQRLDPSTGNIILSGTGNFAGQGTGNPLDGKEAQVIVSGVILPAP